MACFCKYFNKIPIDLDFYLDKVTTEHWHTTVRYPERQGDRHSNVKAAILHIEFIPQNEFISIKEYFFDGNM